MGKRSVPVRKSMKKVIKKIMKKPRKKVSVIAKGKKAKVQVWKGTKLKTSKGLTKKDLVKSKEGKIVSLRRSEHGKKNKKRVTRASSQSRKDLPSTTRQRRSMRGNSDSTPQKLVAVLRREHCLVLLVRHQKGCFESRSTIFKYLT